MKKFVVRTSLLFGSLIITTALLEAALQFFDFPPDQHFFRPVDLYMAFDPVYGWRPKPNSAIEFSNNNLSTHFTFNSRGMRGAEFPYSKHSGTYRILVLGDSFVEGYGIAVEDRVSEQLEQLLNDSNSRNPVEVIAMGTSGYSTDQELLLLEREGVRYDPDLVVLMFYYNDILQNIVSRTRNANKPLFAPKNGKLVLTNIPLSRTSTVDTTSSSAVAKVHNDLYFQSRLFRLITALKQSRGSDDASIQQETEEKLDAFKRIETAQTVEAWHMTRLLLRRMNDTVASVGATFIVFHVPIKVSVYTNRWENLKRRHNLSEDLWDITKLARDFQTMCGEERLQCIEPTKQFVATAQKLKNEQQFLYFNYDPHWTENGHRLAAELLAKYLQGSADL